MKIYQVDAFTEKLFSGNPAAVCPLSGGDWPDEELMQNIALENNLAETAFYIHKDGRCHIRWFTPCVEVDLCGHATLAAAFVLFLHENHKGDKITFESRSGRLTVRKNGDSFTMDFPADVIEKVSPSDELLSCFNMTPLEAYKGKTDYMLVFGKEEDVIGIEYDLDKISRIKARGIIITAPGRNSDFVSRFFAPQAGVNEDPVTGSAHTTLTPYWSRKLNKTELSAIQLSKRKGWLKCVDKNGRIEITGKARLYMIGSLCA